MESQPNQTPLLAYATDDRIAGHELDIERLIDPEVLRRPTHTIPRESEVVFYCAEPGEATSAQVALRAAALGFHDVHPLSGGIEAWREAGFPVEPVDPASSAIESRGLSA